jgi:hypothetical protein
MACRRCAACGGSFSPRPQVPGQRFCSQTACQRERRRRWQRAKRQEDGDYRADQVQAQRNWAAGHREYWRKWRAAHPEYVERNRAAQRRRDGERQASRLAKMDASAPVSQIMSGTYRLVPCPGTELAKMDACTVKLTVVSEGYGQTDGAGAILQREDQIGARGLPC